MDYRDFMYIPDGWVERKLREDSYQLGDGRSVYYQGAETLRDAVDLYTVLSELHGTGSPNLENTQAQLILDRLQTGGGLGEMHIGTLRGLLAKHRPAINKLRRSPDRDGQDRLAVASAGSDSRIIDPATTKEATRMTLTTEDLEADPVRRLRESRGDGLLARLGIDEDGLPVTRGDMQEARHPVEPEERIGVPLREAIAFGKIGLLEALGMDADALREHNANVPLLEALGIERYEVEL